MFSKFFRRKAADPRDLFVEEVEAFLRRQLGVTSIKRLSGLWGLEWTDPQGLDRQMILENLFAETRDLSPDQRQAKITWFVAGVASNPAKRTWDEARPLLVLALRGASHGVELLAKRPDAALVRRPFVPFIDAVVAVDQPTSMSFVSEGMLADWGIDQAAVFVEAETRLPLLARPAVELYDDTHGPVYEVGSNDTYESSRLLVPGWLESFRGRVEGNPVAIMPERATLMVGGDARPDLLAMMIDKADREFSASGRRLSPCVYGLDPAGNVVPLTRGPTPELTERLVLASHKLALFEYESQQRALQAKNEQAGEAVFVATYQVFRAEDTAELRSLSTWTESVPTWLPTTDDVALVQLERSDPPSTKYLRTVAFDSIRERLTPVPGAHPARWETTGPFPGA